MRVLHFYKTAFPDTMGGVEQTIDQIARGANKLGVEIDVLSLTSRQVPRTIEIDGYLAHRAKLDLQIASTGFSISAFLRFSQLAKKADIIHYHFPWPFMDVVHFATRVKKPTVVTYHSDIIRQKNLLKIYQPLQWKFLGDVDRIVATSPNYLATSSILAKYSHKVSVIPIGLDKPTYPVPSQAKLDYWRKMVGSKFFLFIGVIRYYKGLHILMEAAQGTDYPIVIVGAGPIEMELKAQANRLNLRNIYFLGQLPDEDKVSLLTLCYAILFPSHLRSEAFGISLLEGAMYGKPMISSEIGTGTTFINIANQTGLVVPPSDPLAMRQAMNYLWEHPEQAAEMGRHAEERYWEYFTADRMVRSYIDLYADLI
ncbi:glycosyltransferase [Yersinia mollaretii]|uniref:Glycosyltransferase n=1 Tax=Yersinia mollaretii TaxID=33060 RepID=A0AA44HZ61_YERMO|nr:glycosyltransferase family 4 protein [Yersinia mollaretii]NIL21946.1 glycosyltransferase [Yersinia mollaretii]CNI15256.1 WbcW protein [Yersinia mollaretii]CNK47901.1 WbcW protein [Yersinia enterocolitica]CQQ20305.1 WbcW protein [Yersinia mollaretii]